MERKHRSLILWSYREWRCEYWEEQDTRTLRLFMEKQLVQAHHATGLFETLQQSTQWRDALGRRRPIGMPFPLREIPDRRGPAERRAVARGGRRANDRAAAQLSRRDDGSV